MCDDIFEVLAEGVVLCQPVDITQAVDCLISAYFIFNITYEKQAHWSLVFLQQTMKGHHDGVAIPKKVLGLWRRLQL